MLTRFLQDRRGNIAPIFALSIIPVIGFVGAAVDYSRASSARTAMQVALDSTALMLAKEAPNLTNAQLQEKANSYFTAMYNRREATGVSITPTYTASSSTVVVNGSGTLKTSFMGVLGVQNISFSGTSTAKWGMTKLRVALALDNTGSMNDAGKIGALKTATKTLLATLKAAASTNGDVLVAIVPFSKDVNIGASNYTANWIDWSDWNDDNGYDQSTTTCSTSRTGRSGRKTKRCTTSTTWVTANHNTWNGCITDRDKNHDTTNVAPDPNDATMPETATSTLFPAEQYSHCPAQLMGLTYDWTALNAKVDAMFPSGSTNQPIGLVWAWHALTTTAPLYAPAITDPQTQQIIILLSDGMNTEDRWFDNQSAIDARQEITCRNIKAAGITIYTVQVSTDGDPIQTVMKNCASDTSKYFMLTSANQMVTTFAAIGTNLAKLRIAN